MKGYVASVQDRAFVPIFNTLPRVSGVSVNADVSFGAPQHRDCARRAPAAHMVYAWEDGSDDAQRIAQADVGEGVPARARGDEVITRGVGIVFTLCVAGYLCG